MTHPGDHRNEIYFGGLGGVKARLPVDYATLVKRAALPPATPTYVQGGCGDEFTQDHNAAAFQRLGIVPRMMVDCSVRDMSVDIFGMHLPTPIFMSPIGRRHWPCRHRSSVRTYRPRDLSAVSPEP